CLCVSCVRACVLLCVYGCVFVCVCVCLHVRIFATLCTVCPQVRALDNGSPPRYTDHFLTINILDVNDNGPVIHSPRGYNVSISEVRLTVLPPANHSQTHQSPTHQPGTFIRPDVSSKKDPGRHFLA